MKGSLKGLLLGLSIALLPLTAFAQVGGMLDQAKEMGAGSLTSLIGSQVDADETQIEAGLGSLFSYAQESFSQEDFKTLTSAVPGVGGYIDKAKDLGLLNSPIQSLDQLTSVLGRLGMSPETVSKFLPAATQALGQLGGPEIGKLFSSLTAA